MIITHHDIIPGTLFILVVSKIKEDNWWFSDKVDMCYRMYLGRFGEQHKFLELKTYDTTTHTKEEIRDELVPIDDWTNSEWTVHEPFSNTEMILDDYIQSIKTRKRAIT